jgi:hypothetical protein
MNVLLFSFWQHRSISSMSKLVVLLIALFENSVCHHLVEIKNVFGTVKFAFSSGEEEASGIESILDSDSRRKLAIFNSILERIQKSDSSPKANDDIAVNTGEDLLNPKEDEGIAECFIHHHVNDEDSYEWVATFQVADIQNLGNPQKGWSISVCDTLVSLRETLITEYLRVHNDERFVRQHEGERK